MRYRPMDEGVEGGKGKYRRERWKSKERNKGMGRKWKGETKERKLEKGVEV